MWSDSGPPNLTRRQERWAWLALVACLCLMIADRWLVLQQFGFRYTDDDQTIMWYGAEEMAHGRFQEPCFFGQRYNTMLEGLVAVPLLWLGVGHGRALPLMTSALALFPFLLLAGIMVRKRQYAHAAIMLALPITLPPEFGMVSCMPRGFVSGIFLASLAVLPLFSSRGVLVPVSSFFAVLALIANPNAALVLVPAVLLIVLEKGYARRFHLLALAGALPAATLCYLGQRFYDLRPNYQVHSTWALTFSADHIRWGAINEYMAQVTPLLWGQGRFVLVLLGLLTTGFVLVKQWKVASALLIGMALLVASFGLVKVHDGLPSVFYPWSRMFIGVPLLLALFLARSPMRWAGPVVALIPLVAAGFFLFKCSALPAAIERQVTPRMETNLFVVEVSELQRHCERLDEVARAHRAGILVVGWHPTKHVTNYGCPCLRPGFPNTLEPELDRRTWVLQDLGPMVVSNVLFAGFSNAGFARSFHGCPEPEKVSQEPLLYLLNGNTLRTDVLLDSLGLGMRPH